MIALDHNWYGIILAFGTVGSKKAITENIRLEIINSRIITMNLFIIYVYKIL